MPNRLAQESSPYLLQHADNPVDWYPWGEAALAAAREQKKPILLSVGYSACHWCHVMAHESFEDEDTARLMNDLFINIKVDREERPDLDQIYQTAHQLMTQKSGGWPLTMFLTPEGVPFLGGTYFPKTQRYGLPSFKDLLEYVAEAYRKQTAEVAAHGKAIVDALASTLPGGARHEGEFSSSVIGAAVSTLDASFDSRHGGFGGAPKFPHPTDLMLLLRAHARSEAPRPRAMALTTLNRMADGGIFDQLGGGFFRYSVDAEWNIPHFEKMLNDNGPLLRLYAEAFALTGEAQYQRVAEQTAAWVMRDMQSPEGGYFAALDADTEGEEGKFYLWTPREVEAALSAEEYALVARHFGLNRSANFEASHWHLHVAEPLWQSARALSIDNETAERLLASAREKLRAAREGRPRPGLDDKILTAWNALMIEGMARAAAVFRRPEWLASARRALQFIRNTMWADGRLAACATGRVARGNGFLDDYAFLLGALLEVMQVDFRAEDLRFAQQVADALLARFEDESAGGFFFTSHDHEQLIHRTKPGLDHALPGGNGAAAFALQRLGFILGEPRYLAAAERCLRLFYSHLVNNPAGYSMMGQVLMDALEAPASVVLRGPREGVASWRETLAARFAPDVITLALGDVRGLPAALDKPLAARVEAWVCRGAGCQPPVAELAALDAALSVK